MPAGFAKVDDRLTNVDEQFAQVNNRFVRADEDLARIREEGRQGDEETRRFHARAARGRHRADRRARRATFRCSLSQVGTPRLASTPAAALSFAVIGERVRELVGEHPLQLTGPLERASDRHADRSVERSRRPAGGARDVAELLFRVEGDGSRGRRKEREARPAPQEAPRRGVVCRVRPAPEGFKRTRPARVTAPCGARRAGQYG